MSKECLSRLKDVNKLLGEAQDSLYGVHEISADWLKDVIKGISDLNDSFISISNLVGNMECSE